MKIAIDARMAHARVGMGVYVRGLVSHLGKIDTRNDYQIIVRKDKPCGFIPESCNFIRLATSVSYENHLSRDFWEQLYLPLLLHGHKTDVYHGINYVLPCLSNSRLVLTIYDMISFIAPEWYDPLSRLRIRSLLRLSAHRASMIIAGSAHTKTDIVRILNIPEEKIRVIYIGVDDAFRPIDDVSLLDSAKSRYNIEGKFILCVGSFHPRKNIDRLLEAFGRLPREVREEYRLVLSGRPTRRSADMVGKIEKLNLRERVIIDSIADADLPSLMNAADLLVFPSLYEGFGIPPLEAMACGTPVVASNSSSVPEVVGEAALKFDPVDVEDMASAIQRALIDQELRAILVKRGFERVRQFSWYRAAEETLSIYQKVSNERSS